MSFLYFVPATVQEAVELLSHYGEDAKVIAGGTDLVVRIRDGLIQPAALVDIERIPELSRISLEDSRLHIGATATIASILESIEVNHLAPVVSEAARQMGAVQLRNRATIGGNLASAVPSADMAPPLLVLEATVSITGPSGEQTLPIDEFFTGPHQSALRPDEVLTSIEIPVQESGTGAAFVKFGKRSAQVIAVVNAAAWVRIRKGRVEEARIALGAVAPTPIRARGAEVLLRGQEIRADLLEDAAQAAAMEARPITDFRGTLEFRRELCRVLVRRALEQAVQRAIKREQE
ncbi:MAG: xanthine dehydrogenase family protein subunit M [Armatimonadota bacterium]|nr:xanthine dehydrogenase family protein subunit M [Armatimonadota bacterium]MDR5703418.1 xanthine dehydrogenase family protein subunit M [Armatimonadota bacterium]